MTNFATKLKKDLEETKEIKEQDSNELQSLKNDLNEAKKTIKYLNETIQEVSLVNSKLLYAGKIFRSFNLDEKKKITVLESFDRAKTVRETKLLYATITEHLKEAKNRPARTRVKESASRHVASTKPSEEKIIEENSVVQRFKELANII